MTAGLGVNAIGDFRSSTGLAEAARRSILALLGAGVDVMVTEVDLQAPRSENRVRPEIEALPRGRENAIEIHYENTNEFSRLSDAQVRPPDKRTYAIASWYWELPELPWDFMPSVERIDEIWVASEYVQQIFARVTDKPVLVMPAVVEGTVRPEHGRAHFGIPVRSCVYLYNFDASSSYARKNPFGLCEAFERAFAPHERGREATLVVKCMRLHWLPQLEESLRRRVAELGGVLITEDLSNEEMASLLDVADVYVSMHRAEGFGLGMAEAMRLGKPIVATAYSSNTDFCTAENSRQVGYQLVKIRDADHAFHPDMTGLYREGQLWADPDLAQAAFWMRDLFERPRERARLGAAARSTILGQFNRQVVGDTMLDRLTTLDERIRATA